MNEMAVEPVEPTKARTRSRDATVIATAYDEVNISAVRIANRGSLLLDHDSGSNTLAGRAPFWGSPQGAQ